MTGAGGHEPEQTPEYMIEKLRCAFASDPRVVELGLQVSVRGGKVFVSGVVTTQERCNAVSEVAAEVLGGMEIHNDTTVADISRQPTEERIS